MGKDEKTARLIYWRVTSESASRSVTRDEGQRTQWSFSKVDEAAGVVLVIVSDLRVIVLRVCHELARRLMWCLDFLLSRHEKVGKL
jgi:hypothetical protein